MRVFSLTVWGRTLATFLWLLVLVETVVLLSTLILFVARYPFLPWRELARALPALCIDTAPELVTFVALMCGVLTIDSLARDHALLKAAILGRNPQGVLWPLVALGLFLTLALAVMVRSAVPQAHYSRRLVASSIPEQPLPLALRFATDSDVLPGLDTLWADQDGIGLRDLVLANVGSHSLTILTASYATSDSSAETGWLRVALRNGRLLGFDEEHELRFNIRFDGLTLRMDRDRATGQSKEGLLDLKYYTNAELDLLPGHVRVLSRANYPLSEQDRRRLRGIGAVKSSRLQAALLPLLTILLTVVLAATASPERIRRRLALVAAAVLMVLVPMQALLSSLARAGAIESPWVAFLPTVLVGLVSGGVMLLRSSAVRRGRAC